MLDLAELRLDDPRALRLSLSRPVVELGVDLRRRRARSIVGHDARRSRRRSRRLGVSLLLGAVRRVVNACARRARGGRGGRWGWRVARGRLIDVGAACERERRTARRGQEEEDTQSERRKRPAQRKHAPQRRASQWRLRRPDCIGRRPRARAFILARRTFACLHSASFSFSFRRYLAFVAASMSRSAIRSFFTAAASCESFLNASISPTITPSCAVRRRVPRAVVCPAPSCVPRAVCRAMR